MEKKKYRVTGERVLHYCGGDVTRIPLRRVILMHLLRKKQSVTSGTGEKGKSVNRCTDRQSVKITKQNP